MPEEVSVKPRTRLFYLDNLRIYLTIIVILHHAALAYGGLGEWTIFDPAVDAITPIFLSLFNIINQSYFMSAFFLLAGYFTPRSFERKGTPQFLKDRLIRLGIPLVIYTLFIRFINDYMILNFARDIDVSYWTILSDNALNGYSPGHLWFLQALLAFAVIYAFYRVLADRIAPNKTIQIYRDRFPPDKILIITIGILSILLFLEHLVWPAGGSIFLGFQSGFFVHYIFCFFIGVLAYRGEWFRRLERAQARRWGMMVPLAILIMPIVMVLGGAMEGDDGLAKFEGGMSWQAFFTAIWLTFMMFAVIVFLLYYFRERFNQAGPLAKSMAANVFTVYIVHQTVLTALNILLLDVSIPTIVKFFIVGIIAVPVCFVLSSLIRRIPYTKRVLG